MQRFYTRDEWGARDPGPLNFGNRPREAFIHHTTDPNAESLDSLDEQKRHMRGIQAYHMDSNGWSDIGYHYVVYQPYGRIPLARVFRARNPRAIPAAQAGHNSGTLAVCVVGNFEAGDTVKADTLNAILACLASHPNVKTLGGHRDVVSTSCPGDALYAKIPTIAKRAGLRIY